MDIFKQLDYSTLNRDSDYFKKIIIDTDTNTITTRDLYIMFPEKYIDRDMSSLGNTCHILGLICIIEPNTKKYCVTTMPARLDTQPSEINNILIDGTPYVVMGYEANTELFCANKLVKESDFVFSIFDLFLIKGKIPWYYEYNDIVEIFNNIKYYTGEKAAEDQLTIELLVSVVARYSEDLSIEYRNIIDSMDNTDKLSLTWIGLENIFYSYRSTLSKIAGSYMKKGIVSAIINPEKEISDLEHVLRE